MIKSEYNKFVKSLQAQKLDVGVFKMAEIVSKNLLELDGLGTYGGYRAKRIIELAQQCWDTVIPTAIDAIPEENAARSDIVRITKLSVGPFRGFLKQKTLTLISNLFLCMDQMEQESRVFVKRWNILSLVMLQMQKIRDFLFKII